MQGRRIHVDVWLGLILMAFSAFFWSESFKFPFGTGFPRVFLGIFLLMSTLLFVMGIIKTVKKISKGDVKVDWRNAIPRSQGIWGILVGYVILIHVIGFFPATIIASPAIMLFYGVRKIKSLVLVTVFLTLFVYLLFVLQLRVILPRGILFY